jgi:hypothetical protein
MEYLLFRLSALVVAAGASAVTYYNWIQLNTEGQYSMRTAVLAPLAAVMSIFVFLFPKYFGKPETTGAKVISMLVFGIAVAAGLYNLYLMDPSKFGL